MASVGVSSVHGTLAPESRGGMCAVPAADQLTLVLPITLAPASFSAVGQSLIPVKKAVFGRRHGLAPGRGNVTAGGAIGRVS